MTPSSPAPPASSLVMAMFQLKVGGGLQHEPVAEK